MSEIRLDGARMLETFLKHLRTKGKVTKTDLKNEIRNQISPYGNERVLREVVHMLYKEMLSSEE